MNLLEYEAKQILKQSEIPVPNSVIITPEATSTISVPAVLKSQVPTGGRGKLGGIKVVESENEVASIISQLFSLPIKNYLPSVILAEEKLAINKEFYLSLIIDRPSASIHLIAHPQGGIEVEDNNASEFLAIRLTGKNNEQAGEQLAELYDLPGQAFTLQELVNNLYHCFIKNDATLIEINPLVLTQDDHIIAGDCKMTLDAAASFRHPEWHFAEQSNETNFVTLNTSGNVATIANGAGLAMATVDAVSNYGMTPANFLDVGGGANTQSVLAAFTRIMEYKNIQAIVINIFAGITRCDEVAKAIIEARKHITDLPPLCIRLAGTNYEQAAALLEAESIPLLPTLEDCLKTAKEYTT